ncbi:MAG: ABC transporter substrate-binding protein [Anaerolineales bacterium]|jgi:NitT/TauT family transport system substrate-binding protein
MSTYKYFLLIPMIMIATILLLAACDQFETVLDQTSEPPTIRMAVLPILETLPMYVAQDEELFEQYGVIVEFVPVASAPERDQVISGEGADGMINEALSTMFYNQDDTQVQIVRYSRTATPEEALFRILASGKNEINRVDDLKGAKIGISEGTVIEYLTDRLLEAQGFTESEINTVAVPKISDRMALLESGELDAGMLPEPLSSLAVMAGSKIILDDTSNPEISFSTISFRKEYIDNHPKAVRGFLAALEKATQMINENPEQWVSLLGEYKIVPPQLLEDFEIPLFVTAGVPTQAQWEDVLNWAIKKGYLDSDVSYKESVLSDYLP